MSNNMSTKDLVMAIQAGKSSDIQSSFDSVMNDRLIQAISAYKEAVVDDVFGDATVDSAVTEEE